MENPNDNLRILVAGFGRYKAWAKIAVANSEYGSYKGATAAVLTRHGYNVIETTDITVSGEGMSLVDARRWMSRNSLRRFHGEKVKVICDMDAKTTYDPSWVDIMCLIFKKKHSPFVAAVMENKGIAPYKHLKKFFSGLDSAIVLENPNDNCRDITALLNRSSNIILETMNDGCMPHLKRIIHDLEPFKINTRSCIDKRDMKAWSNEKVILFGRTGSGKSSIAQMLTRGRLNASGSATEHGVSPGAPSSPLFRASSSASSSSSSRFEASPNASSSPNRTFEASLSARGMTKNIERGEGRGWHVTDTPGFGEAKGGTVSTEDVTKIIKQFVIATCGIYSHFLYVVKKGRINLYDERLWGFFKKVFADAEENFTVVVTNCVDELTPDDKKYLKRTFRGCENFIYVDFPPVSKKSDVEEENEEARGVSLEQLESGLASLGVADRMSSEGEFSTESLRFVKSEIRAKYTGCASGGDIMDDMIVQLINYLVVRPNKGVAGLFHKSKIDENFILLPQ